MKKRSLATPTKRSKKSVVNHQPITKYFTSPGRASGGPAKDVSSSTVSSSPSNRLKQTKITEMMSPKSSTNNIANESKPIDCKRRLELELQCEKNECETVRSDGEQKSCDKNIESDNSTMPMNEFNDSDEELPEINNLVGRFRDDEVDPEMSYFKEDYTLPKYKFAVDAILEERAKQSKENSEQIKMEQELQGNFFFESKVLEENGLIPLDEACCMDIRQIQEIHPGIQLFDLSKCFRLYSSPPLPKQSHNLTFDNHFFSILTRGTLYNFISMGRLEVFARYFSLRPEILSYFFQLMSSNRDCHIVSRCFSLLDTIKRESSTTWHPSAKDFLTILINYGADIDKLVPSPHRELFDCDQYTCSKNEYSAQKPSHTCLPLNNLSHVFRTMTSFIEDGSNYEGDDLFVMLFAACSVGADCLLTNAMINTEIEDMIDAIVNSFTDDYWTISLNEMVQCILTISSHHHDRVFIAQLMPSTPRGLELQRHFASHALAALFDVILGEINIVHPSIVLSLLKQKSLCELDDYYVLHSAIELIDLVVGCEFGRSISRKLLDDLTSVVRKAESKLRDNANCLDSTEVKNFMVRLVSRWSLLAQRLPSSQTTLFSTTTRESDMVIEVVQNSQNEIDDDDDDTETVLQE